MRAGGFWIVPLDCLGEVHRAVLGDVAKELDKEEGKLGELLWGKVTKDTAFGDAEFLFQEAAPRIQSRKQSTSSGDRKRANFSIQRMRDELAAEKGAHHLPDTVDDKQFVDACRAVAAAVSEITEKCFLDSPSSAPAALVLREDTKELVMSVKGADVQPCHADGNDEAVFGRLEDFDNVHKRNTSLDRAQPLSILAALGQPFTLLTSPYNNKQEIALWTWAKSGGDNKQERPATRGQCEFAEFHKALDLPEPKCMTRIVVPAFHAVFFHQGRVHCGDATSDPYNLRFHAYYDHRELKVPEDELLGTFPLSYYDHGVTVEQKYYAKPDLTSSGITRATNILSQEDAVRAALASHKIQCNI